MIRDFGSDIGSTLGKYGGDISQREQGGEAGEETVEHRKTTDLPAV